MSSILDDATVGVLQRVLGRVSDRAKVVASNLANVDTPGYRAMRAQFSAELDSARHAVTRTSESHRHAAAPPRRDTPSVEPAPITRMRADGNTVDVDVEMTELASLQGRYGTASQLIGRRLALLRYAATDGRS